MSADIRGIEADFDPSTPIPSADNLRRNLHAAHVLARPPFNDSDWLFSTNTLTLAT